MTKLQRDPHASVAMGKEEVDGRDRASYSPLVPNPLIELESAPHTFWRAIIASRVDGVPETLDSALKERLRSVLDRQPVTEAELRKLSEEGRACALILRAQLERSERRLAELAADPTSSLADIAAALRQVHLLRPDLRELQAMLEELQRRAREFRASWLSAS